MNYSIFPLTRQTCFSILAIGCMMAASTILAQAGQSGITNSSALQGKAFVSHTGGGTVGDAGKDAPIQKSSSYDAKGKTFTTTSNPDEGTDLVLSSGVVLSLGPDTEIVFDRFDQEFDSTSPDSG